MPRHSRIVLEVDHVKMFDAIKAMGSDCGPVGQRLAELLLGGEAGFMDQMSLAIYGIGVKSITEISNERQGDETESRPGGGQSEG